MQTTAIIHGPHGAAIVSPARSSGRIRSIARLVAILGALLIEAIVILGFVVLSMGIGAEGQPGLGPDRPPPPTTPPPDAVLNHRPRLALTLVAESSSLLAGRQP